MRRFAALIDRLVYTSSRNAKLRLLEEYFEQTPDPDRGWALAALTGGFEKRTVTPALVRGLIEERTDPYLFRLSYDYVGDLAETVSLLWPGTDVDAKGSIPTVSEVINILATSSRSDRPRLLAELMDRLRAEERFALLKLLMGGMRIGVSARLAKTALARFGAVDVSEVEELWHGISPPYAELLLWLTGKGPKPDIEDSPVYRPVMLANPLNEADLQQLSPGDFTAEWKWDGIRVQLVAQGEQVRLYSRTGDDIGNAFPEIIASMQGHAVILDGELLVKRDGEVLPFNTLQQRLGRKKPGKKLLQESPAHIRIYDILFEGGEDLRTLPLTSRRARLEHWISQANPDGIDLSNAIPFEDWDTLKRLRADARDNGIEGLMLKRRDSPYTAGRPKGPWFKWKRAPLLVDCVVMYAQRGHGKRSSYYSDYTFGCWLPGPDGRDELVPVGKAYSGFTDDELSKLDTWVRRHSTERFGPVRAVEPDLVVEIAFDSIHPSGRHKSGVAMRFPRFSRIRWDKPAGEADRLETLKALIPQQ